MIQVTERYETIVLFSVQISWITRITDPSVQKNRRLKDEITHRNIMDFEKNSVHECVLFWF